MTIDLEGLDKPNWYLISMPTIPTSQSLQRWLRLQGEGEVTLERAKNVRKRIKEEDPTLGEEIPGIQVALYDGVVEDDPFLNYDLINDQFYWSYCQADPKVLGRLEDWRRRTQKLCDEILEEVRKSITISEKHWKKLEAREMQMIKWREDQRQKRREEKVASIVE